MKPQPNIIICTCDQLRSSVVGCYGNPVIQTPNIDKLASTGVRFEIGVTSHPICMAARSSILSGQYPRRCTGGVSNVALKTEKGHIMPEYPYPGRPHLKDPTFPEVLKEHGYYNAAIGKWHIHSWPHDIGFDEYLIPRVHHVHTAQSYTRNGGHEFANPGYSVDFEIDQVEQFLHDRSGESEPFFLFYNISPPHCPVADAPDHYLKMYNPDDIPIHPNVDLNTPLNNEDFWLKIYRYDFRFYDHHLPYTDTLPDGYNLRNLHAEYYGLTTWVDDTVGKLMASLEKEQLANDTIVVFTSDHGDMLGSHGLVQKGYLYEESIHIPYIIRVPGQNEGKVVTDQTANLVDLMPTLLNIAGCEQVEHTHGQDLSPILTGDADKLDLPYSFIETGGDGIGIRTPTHIYGIPWSQTPGALSDKPHYFYDLTSDPYQMNNLAGTGEHTDLAQELDSILRRWHGDTPGMEL
ncbi:MAG: sulfatase-like hydrolase/transferase [Armatimonadota bacterium]